MSDTPEKTQELVQDGLELPPRLPAVRDPGVERGNPVSVFLDRHSFEDALHMAKALAYSTMVPDQYRMYSIKNGQEVKNPDAMGNCVIAIEMAGRLRVSPLMVMQQVDMVKGRPGLRGAFCAALVNQSGLFERLDYEWRGQQGDANWGCRAFAARLKDGVVCYGPWVDMAMAKAEGWLKNEKWTSMPEVMFTYRAAAFFSRRWAPDVIMGMQTVDEIEDTLGPGAPEMVARLEPVSKLDARIDDAGDKQDPPRRRRRRGAEDPEPGTEPGEPEPSPAQEPQQGELPEPAAPAGDGAPDFNVE